MVQIYLFHGLESGPFGEKYKILKQHFEDLTSPDFTGMALEERVYFASELTKGKTDLIIVGSSMGGLVASILASKYPERVKVLVLCAPALHLEEAKRIECVPTTSVIIHGIEDTVVSYEYSVKFAKKHDIRLHIVHDNHRLENSFEILLSEVYQAAKMSL